MRVAILSTSVLVYTFVKSGLNVEGLFIVVFQSDENEDGLFIVVFQSLGNVEGLFIIFEYPKLLNPVALP